MTTETMPETELFDQDASHLSHLLNCPPDKASTEAWIAEARAHGLTVEALCGHRFIPTRDPIRHPVCQACVDAAGIIVAAVNGARP